MKVSSLVLAIALGTAAAGAFAQSAATTGTDDETSAMQTHEWSQAGTFEQQDAARNAQLQQQGIYSQYED
jgi:hypothetical protein